VAPSRGRGGIESGWAGAGQGRVGGSSARGGRRSAASGGGAPGGVSNGVEKISNRVDYLMHTKREEIRK
jgi:hypothetical protein